MLCAEYVPCNIVGLFLQKEPCWGLGGSSRFASALLDAGFVPFPQSWATQQFVTSSCYREGHGLGTSTNTTREEQSQKAVSVHLSMQELFFSFTCTYSFCIQQWKFDCTHTVACFSRMVICLLSVNWIMLPHRSGASCTSHISMSALSCTISLYKEGLHVGFFLPSRWWTPGNRDKLIFVCSFWCISLHKVPKRQFSMSSLQVFLMFTKEIYTWDELSIAFQVQHSGL